MTTARANQTTGLTNGRARNWEPEVEFSSLRAFPSSNDVSVLLLNQPNDDDDDDDDEEEEEEKKLEQTKFNCTLYDFLHWSLYCIIEYYKVIHTWQTK